MAKTVDFEKEIQKNNEECKEREQMDPEKLVVPELKNGDKAVDPNTGNAGEQNTPLDPSIQQRDTNSGNGGGTVPPETGRTPPSDAPTPAPVPQRPQQPRISKEEFQGKMKSFFNADVQKGFWDTLENKLDKMLSGNTAEDIAQNMAFGAIELFFDLITNAIDHHRKEKEKQKDEYLKTKEAYEKELGISARHKKALALVLLASRQGIGPDQVPTKEQIAAMRADAKSADFRKAYGEAMSTITGAEYVKAEAKKDLEFMKKHNFGQVDIQSQVRGVKLNDPMYKTLGENGTTELARHVHGLFQACDAREEQKNIDKEALHKARVDQQAQAHQQGRSEQTPQQHSGRDAA